MQQTWINAPCKGCVDIAEAEVAQRLAAAKASLPAFLQVMAAHGNPGTVMVLDESVKKGWRRRAEAYQGWIIGRRDVQNFIARDDVGSRGTQVLVLLTDGSCCWCGNGSSRLSLIERESLLGKGEWLDAGERMNRILAEHGLR